MSKKVFVGLSGGVDSSVSAALLVEQGYDVTGVYMKNWSRDLPGMKCPWAEDLADAKRVAVGLGIDFRVFDFETEYKHKVVDYMVAEYKAGHTPNPDVMCNQEVKFKLFYEMAREQGADFIATGHYARVGRTAFSDDFSVSCASRSELLGAKAAREFSGCTSPCIVDKKASEKSLPSTAVSSNESLSSLAKCETCLLRAVDENKDQTYFLYRISEEALAHTIFPIGGLTKPEVRALAKKFGLVTASKKESMGVCFVGNVGIREFLSERVKPRLGDIVDEATGKVVGQHDGAIFYTIGQRHGLDVGGGLPYYVARKDMDRNIVYITTDLNNKNLWQDEVKLTDIITRYDPVKSVAGSYLVKVRTRHRAPLIDAELIITGTITGSYLVKGVVKFAEEQRAVAPGQSVVFYDGEVCLGGGIAV